MPKFDLEHIFISFLWGASVACSLCILVARATYFNGVTDGYGFAKHGSNGHEFEVAGQYLRKNLAYRWPELGSEPRRGRAYRPYVEQWEDN